MNSNQKRALYCPMIIKLPLSSYSFNMNYIEVLDETYIDISHVYDCYKLCFCLENKLKIKAGNRDYELLPGNFLFVMPGTPHSVTHEPDVMCKYLIMMIDVPHVDDFDEKNRPLITKINQLSRSVLAANGFWPVENISELLDKMEKELNEKRTGWLFLFRGYCLEILLNCLREVIEPVVESPKEMKNLNLAIEITRYIRNNYREKIELKDIANEFHISPRHAQRIFTDYFGVSLAKTVNLYRMNYARNFLIRTDLSIDHVAERVGLSSAQSLNRLFKEHEGMSAGEYRSILKASAQDKNIDHAQH